MLTRVDRVQLAVPDLASAAAGWVELLGAERQEILQELDAAVRASLGPPSVPRVFRAGGLRPDERSAGLRNLILPRDRFREVLTAIDPEARLRSDMSVRLGIRA